MYGYRDWAALWDLRTLEPSFPTEWDDELDQFHIEERYDRFLDELNAELDIDDEAAEAILRKVKVSARELYYPRAGVDDIDDFASRLAGLLKEVAPQIAAARGGRGPFADGRSNCGADCSDGQ
ncbi:hypothetical protein AWB74_06336 [Caballeronia arvi]|uniref:CdiI immunity protein domain-containing protein n=1 Tax=Caballeronia arvi TaxID=1777135 RepID=A0A158KNA9_9BURK|nr:hypothetical protein [Caballeronia arvi]SAL82636.1 hypothetical protein AWB74_06336 [Caballeronia arvi]